MTRPPPLALTLALALALAACAGPLLEPERARPVRLDGAFSDEPDRPARPASLVIDLPTADRTPTRLEIGATEVAAGTLVFRVDPDAGPFYEGRLSGSGGEFACLIRVFDEQVRRLAGGVAGICEAADGRRLRLRT